jgi:GT2 family glycosyltransferase
MKDNNDSLPIELCRSLVLERPLRLVPPSAWEAHIPFAFWLVAAHGPRLLVELGTHSGNSYCAFLQIIKKLKLPTRAFAVDTWHGDEQAGFYGEDVFRELSDYHDQHYSAFSSLIRSTFDEAAKYFEAGTIDLLHIDGLHTYGAVKHDFDVWLPKMSKSGVVIFHDTNVRERNFGVFKLWEEVSSEYPSFRFDHGHGLGVLGVGSEIGDELKWLFELSSEGKGKQEQAAIVRSAFANLGLPLSDRLTSLAREQRSSETQARTVSRLNDLVLQRTQDNISLRAQIADLRSQALSVVQAQATSPAAPSEAGGGYLDRFRAILSPAGLVRSTKARQTARDLASLQGCPLFDAEWYLARYTDVRESGADPLVHYLLFGGFEARDPHPLFLSKWYMRQYPDVAASGINPLLHYLHFGGFEGRDPHPMFDSDWYLSRYTDVKSARINPLVDYVTTGAAQLKDPSPSFDAEFYAKRAGLSKDSNPLRHFLEAGLEELIPPNSGVPRIRLESMRWRVKVDENYAPRATDLTPLAEYRAPLMLERLLIRFYDHSQIKDIRRCCYFVEFHLDLKQDPQVLADSPELKEILFEIKLLSERGRRANQGEAQVTIIVPVHNHLIHTACCLRAILGGPIRYPYEIIVADDASIDGTDRALTGLSDIIRVVRNTTNVGFTQNCNHAATFARGSFVVLVNNDTVPLPYWLDELIDVLRQERGVGLAGSMLLGGDGKLQEAGGIILSDGSGWNYGRGEDALRSEYNYVKDVDYISGAAIAMRIDDWKALNGFDTFFSPAYYEDVDLAFRVRAAGLRTVYQPLSRVVHHEGMSHGKDVSTGGKAYQLANSKKFYERWKQNLSIDHFPDALTDLRARDRSRGRQRLLVIDHYVPEPDHDSGSRALLDYIKVFVAAGFRITFWSQDLAFRSEYTIPLQRLGVEAIYATDLHTPQFQEWIRAAGPLIDYVLISRPTIANEFLETVRAFSGAKILFFGVDIHFLRLEREFKATGNPLARQMMKELELIERDAWSKSDVIYYYSEDETRLVQTEFPQKAARTIPVFLFDAARLAAARERVSNLRRSSSKQVIYVAGFRHPPNVDGLIWFVANVWPQVIAAVPEASLLVVGSFPPLEVRALGGPSITIAGYVTDEVLRFMYLSSAVSVVPLRYGAGVKGKVLEALSFGTLVVTTPTGVQGIPGAGRMMEICESPEEMCAAVVRLLEKPEQGSEKAMAGIEYLEAVASTTSAQGILKRDLSFDRVE